jgi:anti-anti-sigma factor
MSHPLRCGLRSDGDLLTVLPVGALDLTAAPSLRLVLLKALAEDPAAVIVDLTGLSVDDEACLTLFPTFTRQANGSGTRVLLCGGSRQVVASIVRLGLDRVVPLCSTWDDAAMLAQAQRPGARASRSLLPVLDSPGLARQFVADTCHEWRVPADAAEHLGMIATELVGNAVVHANTPMQLVLRRSRHHVHLAVIDEDERLAVLRGPESARATRGRGLMLVEAFAATWGCRPTATGKCTWAIVRYRPLQS